MNRWLACKKKNDNETEVGLIIVVHDVVIATRKLHRLHPSV